MSQALREGACDLPRSHRQAMASRTERREGEGRGRSAGHRGWHWKVSPQGAKAE